MFTTAIVTIFVILWLVLAVLALFRLLSNLRYLQMEGMIVPLLLLIFGFPVLGPVIALLWLPESNSAEYRRSVLRQAALDRAEGEKLARVKASKQDLKLN